LTSPCAFTIKGAPRSATTTAPSAKRRLNCARAVGVGVIIIGSPWSILIDGVNDCEPAHPADSGLYRFRTKRVYPPRHLVRVRNARSANRLSGRAQAAFAMFAQPLLAAGRCLQRSSAIRRTQR
jgi:hypothetical protein